MKHVFLAIALFFICINPAWSADVQPASAEDIQKAEEFLQSLKSARARFVQTTHGGAQLVGTFYLQRPGKLRFEYDPPLENFVVADGLFIYFYDAELEEQTNAPIRSTLANFFLRENFSLSDDLIVRDAVIARGLLQIEVAQADEPDEGKIIFGFSQEPFELKKWRIVDTQGLITEIELFHLENNIDHDSDLFVYIDPKKGKGIVTYND